MIKTLIVQFHYSINTIEKVNIETPLGQIQFNNIEPNRQKMRSNEEILEFYTNYYSSLFSPILNKFQVQATNPQCFKDMTTAVERAGLKQFVDFCISVCLAILLFSTCLCLNWGLVAIIVFLKTQNNICAKTGECILRTFGIGVITTNITICLLFIVLIVLPLIKVLLIKVTAAITHFREIRSNRNRLLV